jgi:hypothetical protein
VFYLSIHSLLSTFPSPSPPRPLFFPFFFLFLIRKKKSRGGACFLGPAQESVGPLPKGGGEGKKEKGQGRARDKLIKSFLYYYNPLL